MWNLLAPFLFLTLPTITFVSALAVCFETIHFLKHGFGNIVFLFIWLFFIAAIASGQSIFDLTGGSIVVSKITNDILGEYPYYNGGYTLIGTVNISKTFYWNGVEWTAFDIISRVLWVFIALGIVYLTSKNFNRFTNYSTNRLIPQFDNRNDQEPEKNSGDKIFMQGITTPIFRGNSFKQLIVCESFAFLKGISVYWYIAVFVLALLSIFVKIDFAKEVILPLIFLLVAIASSKMSSKVTIYKTEELVLCTHNYNRYQLFAEFIVIVMLFVLSSVGIILRYIARGMWVDILSIIVAAFLISSALLLLGFLSKGSKLFEVSFIITWYIGFMQKTYPIDFINLTGVSNSIQYLSVLLALGIFLLFATYFIRQLLGKNVNVAEICKGIRK